jgi:photosystem II stability/assembly factor-like uncharacterized protein
VRIVFQTGIQSLKKGWNPSPTKAIRKTDTINTNKMKTLSLFICLTLVTGFAFSQWIQQNPLPQGNSLSCVKFVDLNTGYAVGSNGTILKTTDGGLNWFSQTSGTTAGLCSVYFFDKDNGYSFGSEGTILKTTDGGNHWIRQPSETFVSPRSVFFIDRNIGYAVGDNELIQKTIDGGASWVVQYSGTYGWWLTSVFFTDANTGYVVSYTGEILKTTDGGNNWTIQYDYYLPLNSVYFTDSKTGYAVGGDYNGCAIDFNCHFWQMCIIIKTIDGGIHWTEQFYQLTDSSRILHSVYFADANTGYAVGAGGKILKTTDGGTNWSVQSSGTTDNLSSVYFTDANTGYVVGGNGTFLKTTNGGGYVSINEPKPSKSNFNLYPNPATNRITISTDKLLSGETTISVINISGQQLIQAIFRNQDKFEMDVSNLAKGIYLVKIQNNVGIETKKLVIQ